MSDEVVEYKRPPLRVAVGENVEREIDKPRFDANFNEGNPHDWRNHVPRPLRDVWYLLSFETRLVIYATAQRQADRGVW